MTIADQRVAAVGAGRMGRGIALAFAYGGCEIDLIDLKARTPQGWDRLAAEAREDMESSLSMLAELGAVPQDAVARLLGRIHLYPESGAAAQLAKADVIFEGVTETLAAKKDTFGKICKSARPDAILRPIQDGPAKAGHYRSLRAVDRPVRRKSVRQSAKAGSVC